MTRRKSWLIGAGAVCAAGVLAGGALATGGGEDRTQAVKQAIKGGKAKNVILLIGDGMGDSEITLARNYHLGAAGRFALDTLPLTGAYTTYSVLESDPTKPDYTSESASTATAWSTGAKTADGRISTAPGTDRDLKTILEIAKERGLRTGDVTTAELTDATPAAPASHVSNRACQGPADMAACPQDRKSAGGPGSIAEQMIDKKIDVLLGGGRARFAQTVDAGPDAGKTVIQSAEGKGYQVVHDASELAGASATRPLLGLFNDGNLTTEWRGQPAAPGNPSTPQRCVTSNRPGNEPSLAAMTARAIDILDRKPRGGPRPGFFLQVEGASIDKRDHAADPCGQIGETVAFDRAVKVALDYAAENPNTLVVVTGDHAHTSQIVEPDADVPGLSSVLTTNEGLPIKVSYGTAPAGASQEHTGSQIRIAAQGPQAANVVGVTDQTDLFRTMKRALGAG